MTNHTCETSLHTPNGLLEHAVVIVGGGPTGLMLAGELALAGVDVVIIERRANHYVDRSHAKGIHSRAIEVLDQRGIAERFISEGRQHPSVRFGGISLDISDFPTRHNYLLGLSQSKFEPTLADWVNELGVSILRNTEVTDFTQDDNGVTIEVSGGQSLRADYLVGCDGGRSLIRKIAGIDFPGLDASISYIIAEVKMDKEPEFGTRPEGGGISKAAGSELIGLVVAERVVKYGDDPSMDELREALVSTYGTDYGLASINWISRFSDAAHIHPPQGGQGLGTGIQDAVNLGWKLAQVVNKISPESLLDSYHAERYPVGARVLQNTRAQILLSKPDGQHRALHEIMTELLGMDEPRKYIVGMLSGLDIHYDLGKGHPLLGRRMPDLDLQTSGGPVRVFALLHDAKAVLLNLGEVSDVFDISSWSNRVRLVNATYDGAWELPVVDRVAEPLAVLIRPDGYVARVGVSMDSTLFDTLQLWFGAITRG